MKGYCNKCNKFIECLNETEEEEFRKEGSFVCSNCINEEMTKEFTIKFRTNKIDSEELRECIEDNLGVEILEINEKD